MRDASRWLEGAAEQAAEALEQPMEALERALVELGEAEEGVSRALESLACDPGELEQVEERLFAIRALARKHGVAPDDLSAFASDLSEKLSALDSGSEGLDELAKAVDEAPPHLLSHHQPPGRSRQKSTRLLHFRHEGKP